MKVKVTSFTAVALLCGLVTSRNPDDQVGADIDYGTFRDPSVYVRPRFRYWIPDASVNLDDVAADFARVKAVGMGGLELLGYYSYGNFPYGSPLVTDWTRYGWGTPAWKALQDTALRATRHQGMIMDFALGPNQGAGVPAEPGSDGIMWDLWPFNVSVPIGESFDGTLPGWDEVEGGTFVAATTALVTSSQPEVYYALPGWVGPVFYNGTKRTAVASSLQDVTSLVDQSSGHLTLDFPANATGLHYQVFAFYQNQTNYHEQAPPDYVVNGSVPQSPITSFVENGSWVVDHLSSTGAQLVIDFWEDYLLGNGSRELIQDIGNYAWEDSQEYGAGTLVWWTPKLLTAFAASRGYDLTKYLPLIYQYNNEQPAVLASPDHYFTDEADGGMSHINDYWQTLSELNQIYLETLSNWSTGSLQSQFSAQVAYNLPMDMLANVPHVNAPECESLGFNHLVDGYRQMTGPANLAGKRIISSELGAVMGEVYSQTLPELIWDIKRSVAGSVNNFILHGYPYSSSYPNTTWPGWTTFVYEFSNMHGPRQPAWEYYDDYMNWIARVQYVAQIGVPKIDLAFWLKQEQYFAINKQYYPSDLEQAGYTYEYLSPDNFDLPEAYVENGVLAPQRQAFKALIVRANDTLTVSGVEKLVEWAHVGLPIVFSGGVPYNLTGYSVDDAAEYARSCLASIMSLQNVHNVSYDGLAASLAALGITPRTAVSADRLWYTYWREDSEAVISYVYIYNDALDSEMGEGASSGSITFETTGVPYLYDAWTGDVSPILAYQQSNTTTTISLSVAGNQTAIVGLHHNESATKGVKVVSLPEGVYGASATHDYGRRRITIKTGNTSEPARLSTGACVDLPSAAAAMNLTRWSLTVESWSSPSDLYASQTQASLSNQTFNISILQPWNQISDSLRNVSGRGFYTTTFTWPPRNGTADGAMLSLGAIVHTARAFVNGHQLPPLDPTNAIADIGSYLVNGTNSVEIIVTTTLGNALRPIYKQVQSSGMSWLGPQPVEQAYGLVEPVTVLPYRSTVLKL